MRCDIKKKTEQVRKVLIKQANVGMGPKKQLNKEGMTPQHVYTNPTSWVIFCNHTHTHTHARIQYMPH